MKMGTSWGCVPGTGNDGIGGAGSLPYFEAMPSPIDSWQDAERCLQALIDMGFSGVARLVQVRWRCRRGRRVSCAGKGVHAGQHRSARNQQLAGIASVENSTAFSLPPHKRSASLAGRRHQAFDRQATVPTDPTTRLPSRLAQPPGSLRLFQVGLRHDRCTLGSLPISQSAERSCFDSIPRQVPNRPILTLSTERCRWESPSRCRGTLTQNPSSSSWMAILGSCQSL